MEPREVRTSSRVLHKNNQEVTAAGEQPRDPHPRPLAKHSPATTGELTSTSQ